MPKKNPFHKGNRYNIPILTANSPDEIEKAKKFLARYDVPEEVYEALGLDNE